MEQISKLKTRCGSRIYKGIEIPETARIMKSKSDREFYISAILETKCIVRYIDTGLFTEVSLSNMLKYL